MITETIKQTLREQKSKAGLVGSALHVEEYDDTKHNVAAYIQPAGWDITLKVRKGFVPIQDRRQKAFARKKKIEGDGLEVLLTDLLDHECAHWELPHGSERGCPYDTFNHDLITEAVKDALPKDKQNHTGYVTNLFEDTVINPHCREFRGDFSGMTLFWDHEGFRCKQEGQKSFTPLYEAFVKLNMHLWGDGVDRALVKRHYSNESRVDKAVAGIVKDLQWKERPQDLRHLFNKKQWTRMAQTFTRHLAPLIDVSPQERPSAYSRDGNGSGQPEEKQDPLAGNGIEQKARTEEGKEDIVYGRHTAGKGLSPNFTRHDQLHSLYTRLARDIPVKVEAMTRPESLAIAPLTHRQFDAETDDPLRMKLNRLYPVPGGIAFGHEKDPLVVVAREKMQRRSFPDFKLVMLDNSSSMKDAADGSQNVGNKDLIPWGDHSKYHFALLGFYGVEGFIRKQGIAPFIKHGAALFSSGTRYKEAEFGDIQSVYRHVLAPDWGGTQLDASALTKALSGRESFTLSLSDGGIENWEREKSDFKKALTGQHYAHIQIGGETEFSRDLTSWGVPVQYVRNASDLPKLMVQTAKSTYGRFTKQ